MNSISTFSIYPPLNEETRLLLTDLACSQRWSWKEEELPLLGSPKGPQRYGLKDWGKKGEFFCGVPRSVDEPLPHVYLSTRDDDEVRQGILRHDPTYPFNDLIVRARLSGSAPAGQSNTHDPDWVLSEDWTRIHLRHADWLLYLLKKVFIPRGYFLQGILKRNEEGNRIFVSRNVFMEVDPRAVSSTFSEYVLFHASFKNSTHPSMVQLLRSSLLHPHTLLRCKTQDLFARFKNSVMCSQMERFLFCSAESSALDALRVEFGACKAGTQVPSAAMEQFASQAAFYPVCYGQGMVLEHLFQQNIQDLGASLLSFLEEHPSPLPSSKRQKR